MAAPTSLELSVTGVLNGKPFSGQGKLKLDSTTGTKFGTMTFLSPPMVKMLGGNASLIVGTWRGHLGMRPPLERGFMGPLELLGREYISMRLTTVGRYGAVSVSESALRVGDTMRSELVSIAELKSPVVLGMGPLREVITVSGDDTLVGEGRYSLRIARGRTIPVRYKQIYRSLRPNRRLFRRLHGRKYRLRVVISTNARGRTVAYHSRGTIGWLKTA